MNTPQTRYIVAVVPFGETMTDAEQLQTLKRLGIPTERQTIGVWGTDAPERGLWTTDERFAFILAEHLGQAAVWAVVWNSREWRICSSAKCVKGSVIHLDLNTDDIETAGAVYTTAEGSPKTDYTYFIGDRITIG